jgi:hypothetical protein
MPEVEPTSVHGPSKSQGDSLQTDLTQVVAHLRQQLGEADDERGELVRELAAAHADQARAAQELAITRGQLADARALTEDRDRTIESLRLAAAHRRLSRGSEGATSFDLGAALWNQRADLQRNCQRLRQLCDTVHETKRSWEGRTVPVDMSFAQWVQLYAFSLEVRPDLILELGRAYGNSTCLFTEVANVLGSARVVSVSLDNEQAWTTRTAANLESIVTPDWFAPLTVLNQDILSTDFQEIIRGSERVLLYWDAHGSGLAYFILRHILPLLREKTHVVAVDDVGDALVDLRASHRAYVMGGLTTCFLGDLYSAYGELLPLYDFLSRNAVRYATPGASVQRHVAENPDFRAGIAAAIGPCLDVEEVMAASGWVYFSLADTDMPPEAILFPDGLAATEASEIDNVRRELVETRSRLETDNARLDAELSNLRERIAWMTATRVWRMGERYWRANYFLRHLFSTHTD